MSGDRGSVTGRQLLYAVYGIIRHMSCWHSEESNQLAGGMSSCVYKMHELLDAHVVRHVTGHVRFVLVD